MSFQKALEVASEVTPCMSGAESMTLPAMEYEVNQPWKVYLKRL